MPRYKITQHLSGWKTIGNYIDAKDEDEAWEFADRIEQAVVNGRELDMKYWHFQRYAYGSEAYQLNGGEEELMALERKEEGIHY